MNKGQNLPRSTLRPNTRVAGFSLIENLVTLFILTVGLQGLAGLQATSLRINQQAFTQGKAVSLAMSVADRIRANPEGVDGNFYSLVTSSKPVSACYSKSGCTPQEMARNDLWEWNQHIEGNLPGGVGIICRGDTPENSATDAVSAITNACSKTGSTYTVWLVWDANHDGTLDSPFSFSLNGDLSYMMTFEP